MPTLSMRAEAAALERELRTLLGHDQVQARPYGQHLQIQMRHGERADTIARLTELEHDRYTAAFRTHTGRWESLPGQGTRTEMAELVVSLLQPYLVPDNY